MVKRVLLMAGIAAGAAAFSGCVVVPEPGYGYGAAPAAVRVVPPPVVVVPPPVYRHPYRHGPWWR
jgi:hypothetical protein